MPAQVRQRRLQHEDRSFEVDSHHLAHLLGRDLVERALMTDTGVVDDDVERAETPHGGLYDRRGA